MPQSNVSLLILCFHVIFMPVTPLWRKLRNEWVEKLVWDTYHKFSQISAALGNSATIIILQNNYWGISSTLYQPKLSFQLLISAIFGHAVWALIAIFGEFWPTKIVINKKCLRFARIYGMLLIWPLKPIKRSYLILIVSYCQLHCWDVFCYEPCSC